MCKDTAMGSPPSVFFLHEKLQSYRTQIVWFLELSDYSGDPVNSIIWSALPDNDRNVFARNYINMYISAIILEKSLELIKSFKVFG